MIQRCLSTVATLAVISSAVRADEAVDKLMAGYEHTMRAGSLPLLRKLLSELQRLETQYLKEGRAAAVIETRTEIARVKDWLTDASQPVAGGAGPQPGEFKILYNVADTYVFGSWENGSLKMEPKGFSWVNNGPEAAIANTHVLQGPFEASIVYSGTIRAFSAAEADYHKYVHMYFTAPADDARHTIKIKRTANGAMTAEIDGKPVTLSPNNGGREDMFVRLTLHVVKGAKLHLTEMSIRDLSTKK